MNRSSLLLALAVAAGLGSAACGKTESPQQKATVADVKKEARELAASVQDLAQQTKEAFVANAEKELARVGHQCPPAPTGRVNHAWYSRSSSDATPPGRK